MRTDAAYAHELDARDGLARFRAAFVVDDPDLIYLDGNSLGRLPRLAAARVRAMVDEEWGRRLIRGWSEGWFTAPQRLGAKLAELVGARPDEVVVADSTSASGWPPSTRRGWRSTRRSPASPAWSPTGSTRSTRSSARR